MASINERPVRTRWILLFSRNLQGEQIYIKCNLIRWVTKLTNFYSQYIWYNPMIFNILYTNTILFFNIWNHCSFFRSTKYIYPKNYCYHYHKKSFVVINYDMKIYKKSWGYFMRKISTFITDFQLIINILN
jgi:hypothetical protein